MRTASPARTMATDQDQRISEVIGQEQARLRTFIRRRVPDASDAEDILQEVFYELVAAYRLMEPIEQVGAWLFRVARNRIIDRFRKKRPVLVDDNAVVGNDEEESLRWEDLLPSSDAGPDEILAQNILLEELEAALEELPEEQREVFVAHEIEGRSFREMAEETGITVNTLLARKRYAVLHLRRRLLTIYEELSR